MNKRIFELDFLKAIGIVSVVLGHMISPFGKFIFSWHMPLFFFATGYLSYKKRLDGFGDIKCQIKKDFFRLYKYYLVFAIIGTVVTLVKEFYRGNAFSIYDYFIGVFYYMDATHLNSYAMPLWFLPALFISKIITYCCNYFIKNNLIMLFCAMTFFYIAVNYTYIGFGLSTGMTGAFWCLVGGAVAKISSNKLNDLLLFILAMVFLVISPTPPTLDIGSWIWKDSFFKIMLYSCSVIILLLNLGKLIKKCFKGNCVGVTWLSYYSIYIMIVHPYTNNITHIFLKSLDFGFWILEFIINIILVVIFAKKLACFIDKMNRGLYE